MSPHPKPKLLLVGWDSADWKIIQPLVDAGQMPALQRLLEQGTSGNLTTLDPQLSPMLWTSIATGKHAYHHGVPGFTEVNEAGQVVPVSAATRRCKTVWEMLGEHGLKSHVVSWFATQGEQPAQGCMVSNLYNSFKHREEDAPEDWPSTSMNAASALGTSIPMKCCAYSCRRQPALTSPRTSASGIWHSGWQKRVVYTPPPAG